MHQVHAIMYCTQQMIKGENFHNWLKNHENAKVSHLKALPYMVSQDNNNIHGYWATYIVHLNYISIYLLCQYITEQRDIYF